MNKNEISPNNNKPNKYYRTLNINKKNTKYSSKSNKKIDIKLTKPIKIKNLNKIKNNLQQKTFNNLNKNDNQEKEIDASIEENIEKDLFQPINSNKNNNQKINTVSNQYIKINHKSQNRKIKNIKTQIISNDINCFSNIRNHNQLINGGNNKNIHGKLNLNITLNNKSPIRLRNMNSNKKIGYDMDCFSTNKKEVNSTYIYNKKKMNADLNMNIFNNKELNIINNTINNEESSIISLQEEIENLKKDNLSKEKIINDMKKQLEDFKNEQKKKKSNGTNISPLNDDNKQLNNELGNIHHKNTNEDNYNNLYNNIKMNDKNYKYNNEDESALFDKLKINYSNNKNLIDELLNENEQIKRKINDKSILNGNNKNNYSYKNKKEISFNYIMDDNEKQFDFNNLQNLEDTNKMNNYIEESLKKLNKKYFEINQNIDCDNIKLMIKMTLNSNFIPEDDIISLFLNNLLNYEYSIGTFVTKYMKTNDLQDKETIHNYFKSICFDKNYNFDIDTIFNEITSFYDKDIQQLEQIKINQFFSQKIDILTQIIKECKSIDDSNIGLIEISKFKNILNKNDFFNEFNEDETKIFNILIYNMKKYMNIEQIGLFYLSYYNLIEEFGLYDNLLKDNLSENNNTITFENNEIDKKSINLFGKNQNEIESEEKTSEHIEKKIKKRIISNVDFTGDNNKRDRGSGNSNNTYILLSSQKYSFDYSSKSGSKETASLKDGIKELSTKLFESEEYLEKYCKNFVDSLFKICIEEVQRKKILCNNNNIFNFD
jgi:hypothetical protein